MSRWLDGLVVSLILVGLAALIVSQNITLRRIATALEHECAPCELSHGGVDYRSSLLWKDHGVRFSLDSDGRLILLDARGRESSLKASRVDEGMRFSIQETVR